MIELRDYQEECIEAIISAKDAGITKQAERLDGKYRQILREEKLIEYSKASKEPNETHYVGLFYFKEK